MPALHHVLEIQAFRLAPPSCLSFAAYLLVLAVRLPQTSGRASVASSADAVFRAALQIVVLLRLIENRNVQVRLSCRQDHSATYQDENYVLVRILWLHLSAVDRQIFLRL